MNGNFKVGEVLVWQNFILSTELNNSECKVLAELKTRTTRNRVTREISHDPKYLVEWEDGDIQSIRPFNLRRKQPPSGELSILNMFVVAPPQHTKEPA